VINKSSKVVIKDIMRKSKVKVNSGRGRHMGGVIMEGKRFKGERVRERK
jgi:hypothetical protein